MNESKRIVKTYFITNTLETDFPPEFVAATGKKYIVVILAKRPHNSPMGKEFIVKASEIIYNYMVK